MCSFWEPADGCDALAVARPGVDQLLWQETFLWRLLRLQVDAHVLWRVQVRPALVVIGVFDWNNNNSVMEQGRQIWSQIGSDWLQTKRDKSGTFYDQFSVHFGSDLKKSQICPICVQSEPI